MDLRGSLRVSAEEHARIEWRVDGSLAGGSELGTALGWPLSVGRHVVSASDSHGHRADAAFVVK